MCARTRRPSYRQRNDRYGCRLATCRALATCPPAAPGFCGPGAARRFNAQTVVVLIAAAREQWHSTPLHIWHLSDRGSEAGRSWLVVGFLSATKPRNESSEPLFCC